MLNVDHENTELNDYRITRVVHRLSLDIIATGSVMLTNKDVVTLTKACHFPLPGSDHRRELLEVEDVEQRQRRLRMYPAPSLLFSIFFAWRRYS